MQSWGYLVQRASRINLNLPNLISRVPKLECNEVKQMQSSQGAIAEYSDLRIQGRIVLNLWRLLRQEVSWSLRTQINHA
jgi:DNA polymerase zeta